MTETITTNLVGAYLRPPAKALLACLPAGHPLFLRPEPTNEYDENAVQVVLRSSTLPTDEFLVDELETQLSGQGYDLEQVREQDEWHLGFLPKAAKNNPALEAWNVEVQKAIHAVAGNSGTIACSLSFDGSGKPTVLIPWPPLALDIEPEGDFSSADDNTGTIGS